MLCFLLFLSCLVRIEGKCVDVVSSQRENGEFNSLVSINYSLVSCAGIFPALLLVRTQEASDNNPAIHSLIQSTFPSFILVLILV